jgi:hypothetical protein
MRRAVEAVKNSREIHPTRGSFSGMQSGPVELERRSQLFVPRAGHF